MANNRLYLRCNVCGEEMFLGKDFLTGFYWTDYSEKGIHLEDRLNKFFDEHAYCSKEKQLHGDEGRPQLKPVGYKPGDFSLVYEDYPEESDD